MDTFKNIDKLLEKLLSSGEEQVHNICFFMLNSGLRMKEVIDAKFSDIDFKTGTLQIVVPRTNLFNKEKVIKLNQIPLTLLAKIREQYPNDTWVFQSKNKKNQINSHPKALGSQSVLNTIKKDSKHKLSLNCIRHAYATSYFYDTLCVKDALEHESINTTLKYIKK